MYIDISNNKEYPKTFMVRNHNGGMIWQVYHVNKKAAENAEMKCKSGHSVEFHEHWSINKKSIINTINQVK